MTRRTLEADNNKSEYPVSSSLAFSREKWDDAKNCRVQRHLVETARGYDPRIKPEESYVWIDQSQYIWDIPHRDSCSQRPVSKKSDVSQRIQKKKKIEATKITPISWNLRIFQTIENNPKNRPFSPKLHGHLKKNQTSRMVGRSKSIKIVRFSSKKKS